MCNHVRIANRPHHVLEPSTVLRISVSIPSAKIMVRYVIACQASFVIFAIPNSVNLAEEHFSILWRTINRLPITHCRHLRRCW